MILLTEPKTRKLLVDISKVHSIETIFNQKESLQILYLVSTNNVHVLNLYFLYKVNPKEICSSIKVYLRRPQFYPL